MFEAVFEAKPGKIDLAKCKVYFECVLVKQTHRASEIGRKKVRMRDKCTRMCLLTTLFHL